MINRRRPTVEKGLSKRTRRSARDGFTLVELIVVIAIIALLMSILMPALARVKKQAQDIACRSNLRQVGLIIYMYLQEADFRMPNNGVRVGYAGDPRPTWLSGSASNGFFWRDYVTKDFIKWYEDNSYWGTAYVDYVKDTQVFSCAAYNTYAEMWADDLFSGYPGSADMIKQGAFGLNGYLDQLNVNSLRQHGEIIITTDHVEPRDEQAHQANHGDMLCIGNDSDTWNLSHLRPGSATPPRMDYYRGMFRHNIRRGDDFRTDGTLNILWLDNHVDSMHETTGEDVYRRWYDPTGTYMRI
ncbi:MAG: type II secretion system protein [Sedimentisphaerales bacterium]|nr:type II secretion system protein [Sedimentisphaerales bacterium]